LDPSPIFSDLPKSLIAASDQIATLSHVIGIELIQAKGAQRARGFVPSIVGDELREARSASQMGFGRQMKDLGIDFPDHKAEVQHAVGDFLYLFSAYPAQIALIAACHRIH
jgi:hypothetical protein